jgi:hypothetical protein
MYSELALINMTAREDSAPEVIPLLESVHLREDEERTRKRERERKSTCQEEKEVSA